VSQEYLERRLSRSWRELLPITLLGTALSCGFSLLLNYLLLFSDSLTPFDRSLVTAVAVPLAVGAPLSFLLAHSLRMVRRYRSALNRAASYDRATDVLNDAAFTSIVERRTSMKGTESPQQGAFLVVDANTLKSINMRYGREWGEEALRLIVATIRMSLRSDDLLGRLGPSEFGIFLPGASEENARAVGQRILAGIRQVYMAPSAADRELLDVRVAGVCFEGEAEFGGIYRAAETQLLEAASEDRFEIMLLAKPAGDAPAGRAAH
jgi:diguanylate cyclase (GGDEF)-like protein